MIGILSDAHGNGPALHSALHHLDDLGVKRLVYLGDAIGYVRSGEVMTALYELGDVIACVRGNHEEALLNPRASGTENEAVIGLNAMQRTLSPVLLDFVERWPSHLRETIGRWRVLFVHGSPSDYMRGYVFPQTDLSQFEIQEDYIFMGHTHRPFIRRRGSTTFVNVGSIGLPRDDGRFGSFATFDPSAGTVSIYRFRLNDPVLSLLAADPSLHPSVQALFDRRSVDVVGRILD